MDPFALQIYRLYLAGATVEELAAELGIPPERIVQRLRAAALFTSSRQPPSALSERLASVGNRQGEKAPGSAAELRRSAPARVGGEGREFRTAMAQQIGGVPALLYHDVGPVCRQAPSCYTVSPETFDLQVRFLAQLGYQGITASDWLMWLQGRRVLPEKPVLITFDDAYENLDYYALPVLKRYGFRATVFVITGMIGKKTPWEGRMAMSAGRLREWARQGIEIGAHSRSHPDLSNLDAARLQSEVDGSRGDIEEIVGEAPVSFAYPYGAYSPEVVECVRRAFGLAFGLERGLNTRDTDPHLLRRVEVRPSDSRLALACRLRFGFHPVEHLRMVCGVRTRLKRLYGRVGGSARLIAKLLRSPALHVFLFFMVQYSS